MPLPTNILLMEMVKNLADIWVHGSINLLRSKPLRWQMEVSSNLKMGMEYKKWKWLPIWKEMKYKTRNVRNWVSFSVFDFMLTLLNDQSSGPTSSIQVVVINIITIANFNLPSPSLTSSPSSPSSPRSPSPSSSLQYRWFLEPQIRIQIQIVAHWISNAGD